MTKQPKEIKIENLKKQIEIDHKIFTSYFDEALKIIREIKKAK